MFNRDLDFSSNHFKVDIDTEGGIAYVEVTKGGKLDAVRRGAEKRLTNKGYLLVCDSENNRVLELDFQGKIIWEFDGGETALHWPRDIQALKDDSVRWRAIQTLGEIGDERAIEPLNQALDDKNKSIRKATKKALKKRRS